MSLKVLLLLALLMVLTVLMVWVLTLAESEGLREFVVVGEVLDVVGVVMGVLGVGVPARIAGFHEVASTLLDFFVMSFLTAGPPHFMKFPSV